MSMMPVLNSEASTIRDYPVRWRTCKTDRIQNTCNLAQSSLHVGVHELECPIWLLPTLASCLSSECGDHRGPPCWRLHTTADGRGRSDGGAVKLLICPRQTTGSDQGRCPPCETWMSFRPRGLVLALGM